MDYCILFKLSKKNLQVSHQVKDKPFSVWKDGDSETIPLAFIVSDSDFRIGHYAYKEAVNGTPNAYKDFFSIIKEQNKFFHYLGEARPIKKLIYYGLEKIIEQISNDIFFTPSIDRPNFPILFWFADDILPNESKLIIDIFKESGYLNIKEVDFNSSLINQLISSLNIDKNYNKLILTGLDSDLYIGLIKPTSTNVDAKDKIEKLGSDPRVQIVAETIYDCILGRNPYLIINKSTEVTKLFTESKRVIAENSPLYLGRVLLSNLQSYDYEIQLSFVDARLRNTSFEQSLFSKLESCLERNGLQKNGSNIAFFLNGDDFNTPYFVNLFKQKYSIVHSVSDVHHKSTLNSIFRELENNNYQNKQEVTAPPTLPPLTPRNVPVSPPPQRTTSAPPPLPPVPAKPTVAPQPPQRTISTPPPLPPRPAPPPLPTQRPVGSPPPLPQRTTPPPPTRQSAPPPPPPPPPPPKKK